MIRSIARFVCVTLGLLALCGCALVQEPALAGQPPAEARTTSLRAGCREPVHHPFPPGELKAAVDQLPEPIMKVAPVYPQLARDRGVDGTVLFNALICEHGRVVKTVITKSIPTLDAAAEECVVYWSFKPALSAGRPAATWIEVPIRFTLH